MAADLNVRTGFAFTPRTCFTFIPMNLFARDVGDGAVLVEVHPDEGYAPIHLAVIYRLPKTLAGKCCPTQHALH